MLDCIFFDRWRGEIFRDGEEGFGNLCFVWDCFLGDRDFFL